MKRLSSIFLVISFAVLAICNSSCKSSGSEEELGPHNKVPSAENFRSYIISNGGFGTAQILDYRSETDFKAGHIKGAKNITATAQNTASDDAQFCKDVLATFDKTKPLYIYGKAGDEMYLGNVVPGRISRLGFGQQNTFLLVGGFEGWKAAGFEVE